MTGNIFGALRYLPYAMFWKIIIYSIMPMDVGFDFEKFLPENDINVEWGKYVDFCHGIIQVQ